MPDHLTRDDRIPSSPDRLLAFPAQIMSRVYGHFYHARGVEAELRNAMLGSRNQKDSFEGIEWLYGGA